jgi:hypothetical protein
VARASAGEQLSLMLLSFMSESRRLTNRRMKEELRLVLRYPSVSEGLHDTREGRAQITPMDRISSSV